MAIKEEAPAAKDRKIGEEAAKYGEKVLAVDEVSEALIEMLNLNGVDYIFINPGTDTFPIQEAIAKYSALGKRTPKMVLCLHESTAMSAAHGYFMVAGRPQMVFVHVDLGTQNVGGQLHNAQRGHAAMLFCAGRTPSVFHGELRGGRSHYIHWLQEQYNQAGVVHDYVKWEYELCLSENMGHVLQRAFQVAATELCGPVYLTLPREVLMEKIGHLRVPPLEKYAPAVSPQGDPEKLKEAVSLLVGAKNPLILVANAGRHHSAVASLVEFTETVAAPVIEWQNRMNFPTSHDLHLGFMPGAYLEKADVVLIIDHDVPYIPVNERPSPAAKTIIIDIDPIKRDMPLWCYPADLRITADSSKALPAMAELARRMITPKDQERYKARSERLKGEHDAQRARWKQIALAAEGRETITADWLAHCIAEVSGDDVIYVNETVTNYHAVAQQLELSRPGTFFQSGGSSLGWSLGASLGAKLAAPDKTVIDLSADGNFANSTPMSAFWAADTYKAPFLVVVFNNRRYHAVKRSIEQAYEDGYSVKTGKYVATEIPNPPSFELVAKACRAYAETVSKPSEVKGALKSALDQVRGGRAALVDVMID